MSSKDWILIALIVPMIGLLFLLQRCDTPIVDVNFDLSGSDIKAIEMHQGGNQCPMK